jgi:DNA-binding SARP family transcriptional activator
MTGLAGAIHPSVNERSWPILICLLGGFRLLKMGHPVSSRTGEKTKGLLRTLALHPDQPIPREALLDHLWSDVPFSLAGQSLNSLVHNLHKSLGHCIGGAPPRDP